MQPFEQMGRRHIGEIERRILPQQNDVHLREIDGAGFAEVGMRARLVPDLQRLRGRDQRFAFKRKTVGRVIEQLVAPRLRLQQQCEGRVAGDVMVSIGSI